MFRRGWYVIVSWLPLYVEHLGVDAGKFECWLLHSSPRAFVFVTAHVGFYAVIPYLAMLVVDNGWSQVADSLILRHGYKIEAVRKISQVRHLNDGMLSFAHLSLVVQTLGFAGASLSLLPCILLEEPPLWYSPFVSYTAAISTRMMCSLRLGVTCLTAAISIVSCCHSGYVLCGP